MRAPSATGLLGLLLLLSATAAFAQGPIPRIVNPNVQAGKALRPGGPPPSLLYAVLGLQIGRKMPINLKPGLRAQVRVVLDEAGAVLVYELVKGSGDAAFDAALSATVAEFAPDGKHRLTVPGDKALRKQVLGAGITLTVLRPHAKRPGPLLRFDRFKKLDKLKKIKRLGTPKGLSTQKKKG